MALTEGFIIQTRIDQLKEQLAKLEEALRDLPVEKKEWPQEGEKVFVLWSNGVAENVVYFDDQLAVELSQGNLFPSKEKSLAEKMRREARAKAWLPEEGQKYFYAYSVIILRGDVRIHEGSWDKFHIDWMRYCEGNVHKTREDAEHYAKTYLPYFMQER